MVIEDNHLVNIVKVMDLGITLNTTACLDIVSIKNLALNFGLIKKTYNYNQMFRLWKISNFQILKINVNNFDEF